MHEITIHQVKIGFIGGGNMAAAIIGGLINAGVPAANLAVSALDAEKLQTNFGGLGVATSTDNAQIVAQSEVLLLAIKPQLMPSVLQRLAEQIAQRQPLVISVAAGIPLALIQQWSAAKAVVRVMPNTPALVGAGATGLYANEQVSTAQRGIAQAIMQAVGVTVWLESEALIDSVTAVSGSGPAYFFYMIEALEAAAMANGLSRDDARLLSRETALGAAKLASQSAYSMAELRERVTSPGGTTAAALAVMTQEKFSDTIKTAVASAVDRAQQLAKTAALHSAKS